jgi:uncharacterized protein with ACT and thioredoxin-like domain
MNDLAPWISIGIILLGQIIGFVWMFAKVQTRVGVLEETMAKIAEENNPIKITHIETLLEGMGQKQEAAAMKLDAISEKLSTFSTRIALVEQAKDCHNCRNFAPEIQG